MSRIHWRWAACVILVSVIIYPATNRLTVVRADRFRLYFPAELSIPLIPEFIWAYLTMYVVFCMPLFLVPAAGVPRLGKQLTVGVLIAGASFLLLPAELGFVRTLPDRDVYRDLFAMMFEADLPHNLVPSLHVIYCATILLACADYARPAVRAGLLVWLTLIVLSTVFVHQHHLLDVAAALGVVAFVRGRDRKWNG